MLLRARGCLSNDQHHGEPRDCGCGEIAFLRMLCLQASASGHVLRPVPQAENHRSLVESHDGHASGSPLRSESQGLDRPRRRSARTRRRCNKRNLNWDVSCPNRQDKGFLPQHDSEVARPLWHCWAFHIWLSLLNQKPRNPRVDMQGNREEIRWTR
jgi:hypothetical protein